jgi:hypothetical protein
MPYVNKEKQLDYLRGYYAENYKSYYEENKKRITDNVKKRYCYKKECERLRNILL